MQKGLLYTGTIGGIVGVIMAATGIAWGYLFFRYFAEMMTQMMSLTSLTTYLYDTLGYGAMSGILAAAILPSPSSGIVFLLASVFLSMLLVINGILVGLGFHDVAQEGKGLLGTICLGACIIGALLTGALLVLGSALQITMLYNPMVSVTTYVPLPVSFPELTLLWRGLAVLGAVLIIVGITSIAVRKSVDCTESALLAGVLGIIAGILSILQVIPLLTVMPSVYSFMFSTTLSISDIVVPIFGMTASLIWIFMTFALCLVAYIFWIRMFYSYGSQK
nr:hypothetical protein [Candidatus Freyarchaeota archaeon]